jgi:radical SAM superfamily enzyme
MGRDDYVRTLVDFLAPPDYFVGPSWCLDKPGVLLALRAELERRDTWQGKHYEELTPSPSSSAPSAA